MVRDDIERGIAFTHYPDMNKINLLNNLAKSNSMLHKAYENKDLALYKEHIENIEDIMLCLYDKENLSFDDVYVVESYENTEERLLNLLEMDIYFSKLEEPTFEPEKVSITQSECDNLMN